MRTFLLCIRANKFSLVGAVVFVVSIAMLAALAFGLLPATSGDNYIGKCFLAGIVAAFGGAISFSAADTTMMAYQRASNELQKTGGMLTPGLRGGLETHTYCWRTGYRLAIDRNRPRRRRQRT